MALSDGRAAQWATPIAVLLLVWAVYWPVRNAGFVWDDIISFVENDWLRTGSQWQHYVLRDFHGWLNYFRPLGVALFTVQVRLFDNQPAAMHLVSLALHLGCTALVGAIVAHSTRVLGFSKWKRAAWLAACMVAYGLHPALIEAVAWIGCQFELLVTGFTLMGAWAAIAMRLKGLRATTLGLCFFLAACAKESAVVFPALVLLLAWAVLCREHHNLDASALRREFLARNLTAIVAMVAAGIAYLCFRYAALGYLLHPAPMYGGELSTLGNVQKIAWTLWSYLRLLIAPAMDLNPVHSFDPAEFEVARPGLLAFATVAAVGMCWAIFAAVARGSLAACLVLMFVAGLFPALNILPMGYAIGLYHERYIMMALAFCCALLPLVRWPRLDTLRPRAKGAIAGAIMLAWVASSLLTIRTTLPMWRDDETLWRWAITRNATNEVVQYNLIAALLRSGRLGEANAFVERFAALGAECARCDIEVASFELDRGNTERAALLIDRFSASERIFRDLNARGDYFLTAGQLALAQGRPSEASELLRAGIALHPGEPSAYVLLAEALAGSGKRAEAIFAAERAVTKGTTAAARSALKQWRDNFVEATTER